MLSSLSSTTRMVLPAAAASGLGRSLMPVATPCAPRRDAADAAAARGPAHPASAEPPPRATFVLSLSSAAASVKRGGGAARLGRDRPGHDRPAGAHGLSLPRLLPRRRTVAGAAAPALPG